MIGGMDNDATTLILPVGDFTSAIAAKVADALGDAAARGRTIVISLQWTKRCSWGALCELAESLEGRYRHVRVSFTRVAPALRGVLLEAGLGGRAILNDLVPARAHTILISAV
jgi:hypothetical protein